MGSAKRICRLDHVSLLLLVFAGELDLSSMRRYRRSLIELEEREERGSIVEA